MMVRGPAWGQWGHQGEGRPVLLMSLPAQQSPEDGQGGLLLSLPFLEEVSHLLK